MYQSFPDLVTAYLDHLKGRPCHATRVRTASQWIRTLRETPTRAQLLERHRSKGHGDFQPGSTQANAELALVRAACRWGIYHERWTGGDPTVGIKKWRTAKRRQIGHYEDVTALLRHWARPVTPRDLRDRALFGIMLLTGCRPSEIRHAKLGAIVPYGTMGCWRKPTTKTGEAQEIPVPTQAMAWLAAWMAVRYLADERGTNPYLFPGQRAQMPLGHGTVRGRWAVMRRVCGIAGLWNYDLRRTMASYLGNELHYDDSIIQAVLNHHDGRALSHYYHVSFDALTGVVQKYADWLCGLNDAHEFLKLAAPARESTPANGISTDVNPRAAALPESEAAERAELSNGPPIMADIPTNHPLHHAESAGDPLSTTLAALPAQPVIPPLVDMPMALSRREREVFVLLSQGQSTRKIAQSLAISQTVASSYCRRIKKKLQATNTSPVIGDAGVREADMDAPIPVRPMPRPVIAPIVMAPIAAIVHTPYKGRAECEEWPG